MRTRWRLGVKAAVLGVVGIACFASYAAGASWGTLNLGTLQCAGIPEVECVSNNVRHAQMRDKVFLPVCLPAATGGNIAITPALLKTASHSTTADEVARAVSQSARGFRRVPLANPPAWSISASWSRDGNTILVVDAHEKNIIEYSLDGRRLQTIAGVGSSPSVIQRTEEGYVLQTSPGSFSKLGEKYGVGASQGFSAGLASGDAVSAVWGWTSIQDRLLVFGDVEGKQGWRSSFLRVGHSSPVTLEELFRLDKEDQARQFFLFGYPLMAATRANSYILVMSRSPYLVEIGFGVRKLRILPKEYSSTPVLPEARRTEDAVTVYSALERSKMPVAIYGWKGNVYLLTRKPKAPQQTEWVLWKIDVCLDRIVGRVTLPTDAEHVVVAPGLTSWAIIEKGPVTAFGRQSIESLLVVEGTWLERNIEASRASSASFNNNDESSDISHKSLVTVAASQPDIGCEEAVIESRFAQPGSPW
jgi:hypothetical protein